MILTDATTSAITRARQFVDKFRHQERADSLVDLLGLGGGYSFGSAELYLMEVALEFAEAAVELADGTSVARTPTQITTTVIKAARRIAWIASGEVAVESTDAEVTREDFARAVVELAGARPNKIDAARADRGDWHRAAGDALCVSCESPLHDHPVVPGIEWLRRRCDGKLVKL